jgi:hypothetical protein
VSLTTRARQVVLLLRPLARAAPRWPLAAAAGMSVLLLTVVLLIGLDPRFGALPVLRVAAVLLGAGASFVMVDQMAPTVVSPTPRWVRQWIRVILGALPAAALWLILYGFVRTITGADLDAPARDLIVEALVCGLSGMAGAAVAARVRHTASGALAGPITQGALCGATLFLTGAYSPWLMPYRTNWDLMHRYWVVLLSVIATVLMGANRETWPLLRRQRRPC